MTRETRHRIGWHVAMIPFYALVVIVIYNMVRIVPDICAKLIAGDPDLWIVLVVSLVCVSPLVGSVIMRERV